MDDLFTLLLILKERLEDRIDGEVSFIDKAILKVDTQSSINRFVLRGMLIDSEIRKINCFDSAYDKLILREIKELLILYKDFLASKATSENEYRDLFRKFDTVFYNAIIVRFGIENLLIDK
jgi:hypothetical protein